jgi:hypothetical protein
MRFSKITRSRANLKNVQITGAIQVLREYVQYYDRSMTRKFELITVYSEQSKLYKALFLAMRGEGWQTGDLPDLSQGREWDHVIFDAVIAETEGSGLGFLK